MLKRVFRLYGTILLGEIMTVIKLFVSGIVLASLVGCAPKNTGPTVQSQLDDHIVAYVNDKKVQEERDAKQDAAIVELYEKVDRVFAKK